ncbi:hypothetical protein COCSUDRAFT_63737 [Coccomyxa subellipsoidea C-169]|uniref:FHA domain-containing protein n=1 Tax=Coccomyxa subellipsoidea (strain C-169) TaxID=574566 RepID=I0YW23_COCSC|nr:hypothetical protein COCSUDRAFT_63737 [Coccomyxa subellipsoidea C-169]EIE22592.1 hypothetical protein COCSUDRAFT_63737 [Coccomyxa subellipsoidea C-169]|eukprot:XP_005647136.1 hypothetical protein COCSUDRAFT_63737 [Coccomyxa subellipsoidea C-169]
MAFTMKSVAPSTRFLSPRPVALTARSSRGLVGRSQLVIEAKTVWQLAPKSGKTLEALNLTDDINTQKSFVSVGDKKHQDAEQIFSDEQGVYVKFESKGASASDDSQANLYLTDLGSETSVTVDGKEVSKDQEVKLRVGSEISFGSSTVYKVLRDERAHA